MSPLRIEGAYQPTVRPAQGSSGLEAEPHAPDRHEVARVGDRIKVRVLEVDLARKRIALSAKPA